MLFHRVLMKALHGSESRSTSETISSISSSPLEPARTWREPDRGNQVSVLTEGRPSLML